MKYLDQTLATPAENIACDEELLATAERGDGGEVLRVWESPETFVVVGYGNRIESEVNVAACAARNIPVLRRCSGGGTVVQGQGCLSYALVLKIADNAGLSNVTAANRFIMERNRVAISQALSPHPDPLPRGEGTAHGVVTPPGKLPAPDRRGLAEERQTVLPLPEGEGRGEGEQGVQIQGHTDLTRDGLKFSGNAQRRRRNFILFHGTFLLNFDLALIGELLPMPSRQPCYRDARTHEQFLTNLPLSAPAVKAALRQAWGA